MIGKKDRLLNAVTMLQYDAEYLDTTMTTVKGADSVLKFNGVTIRQIEPIDEPNHTLADAVAYVAGLGLILKPPSGAWLVGAQLSLKLWDKYWQPINEDMMPRYKTSIIADLRDPIPLPRHIQATRVKRINKRLVSHRIAQEFPSLRKRPGDDDFDDKSDEEVQLRHTHGGLVLGGIYGFTSLEK